MKKLLLSIAALFCILSVHAQQLANLPNGYYRVNNVGTGRYIYVLDNTGSINVSTATADMGAIRLFKDLEATLADPASVLYIEKHGDQYDITAQATGIYQMINTYVNLMNSPRISGAFWAYGKKGGQVMYLYDAKSNLNVNESYLSTNGTVEEMRNWYITPIDNNTDNYFGIKPTISNGGKYYQPFYADFPFSLPSGMKAYYVNKIDEKRGLAIYKEITGVIPRSTPVIIECSSDKVANNKVNLGGNASAVSDNMLKGVYFESTVYKHENLTKYTAQMRSLGVTSDGKLGLIKADYANVPRSQFYLPVSASAPAQFKLVTQSEYDNILANEKVEATAVTLSSTTLSLTIGATQTLTAKVTPDNTTDKTVTWTTSNSSVATVNANGMVTAVAVGSATITATCGKVSATCTVTVNPIEATAVTLSKTSVTLNIGEATTLTATVSPDNTTNKTVTWTTSNSSVATVDANGKVTAVGVGTATITATCGKVSATCTVTVNPIEATAVTLSKTSATLYVGDVTTLTATVSPDNTTNKTVTWTTSDASVATVDNGKVTALKAGTATITATCGKVSASCAVTVINHVAESITLNLTQVDLLIGESKKLVAEVAPANAYDKTVTWTTSDASVATVAADGNVTAVGVGTAVITARCGDVTATCTVTVNPVLAQEVTLNKTSVSIDVNGEIQLTATVSPENTTDKTVVWTSSDEEVAMVDQNGLVKAIKEGKATITATCGNVSATCEVEVKAIPDGIAGIVGDNVQFDVYNVQGVKVRSNATSLEGLPAGVYIVNGVKVYVRK